MGKTVKLIVTLLASSCACGQPSLQTLKIRTESGNFPRDLYGPLDTRMAGQSCNVGPCIWGHADSDILPIKFSPPHGYRVRILRLRGDLTAFPKVLEGEEDTVKGYAGILLGFSTTSSTGSRDCNFCASGCMLYIQDNISGPSATRAPFNYDYLDYEELLDKDNILNLKIAEYLNTMGKPIHIEATYSITYQYVRDN